MTLAIALRHKNIGNETARQAVVDAAMKYENLPYDLIGAIGSGALGNKRGGMIASAGCVISLPFCGFSLTQIIQNASDENADKAFFCSELVARAFTVAGYPIVDGRATDQTPGALRLSPYLMYVGHLIDTPPAEYVRPTAFGYRHD